MVDPSDCNPAHGQAPNSELLGPGCNGWFEANELLLLFIHPDQWKRKGRRLRPGANNFTDQEQSSDWYALKSPQQIVEERPGYGVVALSVAQCVSQEQTIKYTPVIDDKELPDNPAHCDIAGEKEIALDGSLTAARWFAANSVIMERSEKDK